MKLAAAALFAALTSSAQAALKIINPSASSWWVANSDNLLAWSCQDSTVSTYTVVVFGSGTLKDGLPIISILNNFDCSKTIPPNGDLPAGTNYTIALTNTQNRTDILAASEPFEIKPYGSTYPQTSVTTVTPTATGTNSGSPTASSTTSTSSKGAAAGPIGASSAIISGVAFVLGAFLA